MQWRAFYFFKKKYIDPSHSLLQSLTHNIFYLRFVPAISSLPITCMWEHNPYPNHLLYFGAERARIGSNKAFSGTQVLRAIGVWWHTRPSSLWNSWHGCRNACSLPLLRTLAFAARCSAAITLLQSCLFLHRKHKGFVLKFVLFSREFVFHPTAFWAVSLCWILFLLQICCFSSETCWIRNQNTAFGRALAIL